MNRFVNAQVHAKAADVWVFLCVVVCLFVFVFVFCFLLFFLSCFVLYRLFVYLHCLTQLVKQKLLLLISKTSV